MNSREYKIIYVVLIAMVLTISTIGSTYAYLTATINSVNTNNGI